MSKRLLKYTLRLFLTIVVLLLISENFLCYSEVFPVLPHKLEEVSDHGFPSYLLGWKNASAQVVADGEDPSVLRSVGENCGRVTPFVVNPDSYALFMGCSYTLGMGVSDHENYVWRIAEHFPNVQFDNLAANNYGTQQCCMLMAKLEYERQHGRNDRHYDNIFYGFIGDHFNRNWEFKFSNDWKNDLIFNPGAEMENGTVLYHGKETVWWPGCDKFRLAVFFRNLFAKLIIFRHRHYLHSVFMDLDHILNDNEKKEIEAEQYEIFNGMISDMLKVSKSYGAKFYLIYLESNIDDKLDPQLFDLGLNVIDIVYPDIHSARCRTRGHGSHPNASVHKYWADSFVERMKDKF